MSNHSTNETNVLGKYLRSLSWCCELQWVEHEKTGWRRKYNLYRYVLYQSLFPGILTHERPIGLCSFDYLDTSSHVPKTGQSILYRK